MCSEDVKRLPNELVILILSYSTKNVLCACCRANKRFRDLCLPILYREIAFEWGWSTSYDRWNEPRPWLLVRTLMRRPDLALEVQGFLFATSDPTIFSYPKPYIDVKMAGYDEDDVASAVSMAFAARIDDTRGWRAALDSNSLSAWIPLLLCCATGLRTLRIGSAFRSKMRFANQILREHTLVPLKFDPTLQRLRSVQLGGIRYDPSRGSESHSVLAPNHCIDRGCFDDEPVLDFLYLPAIESLEACCQLANSFEWPREPPRASHLKSLTMRNSEVPGSAFDKLLQSTPNLESLHYSCWFTGTPFYAVSIFDPPLIRGALQHVRKSLRHLSISASFALLYGVYPGQAEGIGSLLSLESLETLEISLIGLLGYLSPAMPDLTPKLPRSLKTLTLLDDGRSRISGHHSSVRRTGDVVFAPGQVPWESNLGLYELFCSSVIPWLSELKDKGPQRLNLVQLVAVRHGMNSDSADLWKEELPKLFSQRGVEFRLVQQLLYSDRG